MGTLLKINGRVFEINNRENGLMKGWGKRKRIKPKPEPEPEQHEYVDLGLPSGTLWATENIKDAVGNELYFSWGGTSGFTAEQVGSEEEKRAFTWDDYEFGDPQSKYNQTDGLMVLEPEDDAATANWGSNWKIPTKAEFEELLENTTSAWTEVNGVYGAMFTSTVEGYTENSLFFHAVGYAEDGEVYSGGDYGSYWSVSLDGYDVSNAWLLDFGDGYCSVLNDYRYYGFSVRPVRL